MNRVLTYNALISLLVLYPAFSYAETGILDQPEPAQGTQSKLVQQWIGIQGKSIQGQITYSSGVSSSFTFTKQPDLLTETQIAGSSAICQKVTLIPRRSAQWTCQLPDGKTVVYTTSGLPGSYSGEAILK